MFIVIDRQSDPYIKKEKTTVGEVYLGNDGLYYYRVDVGFVRLHDASLIDLQYCREERTYKLVKATLTIK